jgi:hypothetical protein
MSKYRLYELKGDWSIENGTLVSSHKTKNLAYARLIKEAKKKVKQIYYIQITTVNDKTEIYDYGLYNRFYAIREEEEDDNA